MSQQQLPALVESLRTGGDVSTITPTVIDVQSEDEIGELAQAFNDVEQVTLEVAQQQSILLRKGMGDLFVNLARRNQSLLERQLELLDELERNEHDPSSLDSLFKLDHMATRMRRNAESLLVLSGAEQPRQWQEAIGLLDVVRSAAAEIADFPHVELVGIDERISVSGRAVSDVSHLLAELLENATSFSNPETAVVVSGAITKSGFVLAITDQGIGMTPDRIAEANTLLRHPPVVGLALSRALGLHVVGALAKRHGIAVEIRKASPVGTVALVALPKAILEARGRNEGSTPMAPVYSPDVDDDGTPMPLGARRAAPAPAPAPASASTGEPGAAATAATWHPADEPPVEQSAREADAQRRAATCGCRNAAESGRGAGRRAGHGSRAEPAIPETTFVEDSRSSSRSSRRRVSRRPVRDAVACRRAGCRRPAARRARLRLRHPTTLTDDSRDPRRRPPRPTPPDAAARRRGRPLRRPAAADAHSGSPHDPPSRRRRAGPDRRGRPDASVPRPRVAQPPLAGRPARPGTPRRRSPGQRRGGPLMTTRPLSAEARNLNWLVSNFAERVPGVREATVVSSDGLLIALSDGLDRTSGDRLAAVAAGMLSIAKGASTPIGGGRVHEVIVEMDHAMLFVMRVSDTSVLAVTTARPCDVGLVGYEMAVLVDKSASALTPALVSELQTLLPRSAIR